MDGPDRRNRIKEILENADEPVKGSILAAKFGVSRQIIVQDIALLRATGQDILATPQGYMLVAALTGTKIIKTFAVKHRFEGLEKELNIIVDNGGKVLDVVVEHPIYGELRGMLMLSSRRDVQDFIQNLQESNAHPLSVLTEGVHLHTVEAPLPQVMEKIEQDLDAAGILLNK
ncbi:MAG: transcription repressor NadR [Dehalobacterium sp.]